MEAPLPERLAETPVRSIPGARLQPAVECRAVGIEDRRQRERGEVGRGRNSHSAHRFHVCFQHIARAACFAGQMLDTATTTLISDVPAFYPACSLKVLHLRREPLIPSPSPQQWGEGSNSSDGSGSPSPSALGRVPLGGGWG